MCPILAVLLCRRDDTMTHDAQWKCLSEGPSWKIMKLFLAMTMVGLGMEAYLLLTHGLNTLGDT